MNILKPQKLNFKEFENKCLTDMSEEEINDYCNFENEECNNINTQTKIDEKGK